MEETIVTEASFLEVLLTSPMTYIIALIIGMTIYQVKKEKSSPKSQKANKTSSPSKPKRARTNKGKYKADDPKTAKNEVWVNGKAPKKKATKKTPTKKTPTKKAVKKRTPKKGGK
jgi:hypothetical protein